MVGAQSGCSRVIGNGCMRQLVAEKKIMLPSDKRLVYARHNIIFIPSGAGDGEVAKHLLSGIQAVNKALRYISFVVISTPHKLVQ